MSELLSYASEFNSSIKFLARVYASKKKGTFEEEKSLRTNKRLSIVMASDPMWMIGVCGPFFLKYADLIQNRDWDAFLKCDFTEEKIKYKNSEDGGKHSYDAMEGKIQFIKKVFVACPNEERVAIGDSIQRMLSAYCKYAIHIKRTTE